MDGPYIEPRKTLWAMAEITWQDDAGTSVHLPSWKTLPNRARAFA
jgi:hypothetical protein